MKKKSIAFVALTVASALVLSACAGGGQSAPGTEGQGYEPIVIYSNSVSDGRGAWLTAEAQKAGFDIQYVDLGGADVMNRLIAEKANPVADVVFGLNQVYYEKLDAEGVLAESRPAWADMVDAETFGNGSTYWPIVREPIMLVYDTSVFSGATAPRDWPDLWTDSRFENRYETPAALGGATTQMVLAGILSRYRDDAGALGVSDEGWAAIGQYFSRGNRQVEGEDLYARMAAGVVAAGPMWLAGKATREEQYGVETAAASPQGGVPMVAQSIAIVEGTGKAATATAFLDWFGGADVQSAWSEAFFTVPTNADALAGANPQAVEETDAFAMQDIDWEFVAANIDAWIERIELEYLG